MPKTLQLILILLLGVSMLNAGDYLIGSDTTSQKYVPLYGYVNYNWSKFFYTASEMQAAGFTDTLEIVSIGFQVENDISNYVTDNQQVYMRAFYDSEYASNQDNYPGTAGFFHVFSGSVTWNGPGWVQVELDTPYTYNPNWGIEILWENRDGSRIAGPPYFCYTATSNYTSVSHNGSSSSFPTSDGSRKRDRRPNIWFVTPTTEAPAPAVAVSPLDNATDISIDSNLRWNQGGGSPQGYRLWLGTDNPPSNIISAQVVLDNRYVPEDYLEYATTYYWRVVPYNEFGNALDCPTWQFSTMDDPSIADFPYLESFDLEVPPAGWTDYSGGLADPIQMGNEGSSLWDIDDWLNISSTDKAAKFNIMYNAQGYLISPLFNIPDDNYVLEFDAALLKYNQTPEGTPPNYNAPDDRFAILIGDGFSWSTANIVREYNNSGSEYVLDEIPVGGQRISIPLSGHTGHIRIAIFAGSTEYNDDNDFMINNFRVGIPELVINPPEANITLDAVSGQPVLAWEAVPGATTYRIYKSGDPTQIYEYFDTTDGTSYQLDPVESKAFFKITAE
ncbi:MAG: hypothetical protein LHW46_05830 [Candidatus Cloacimonetes bacterium]|jgi:hypothetical protein|nr:hypothetical protein [Candidatus Cloacimonadota bacterium]MDY0337839.1 hypothetical protein [Candidatus Cloacimonadaceae bacterium]MCB5269615.1 hypothetical protein [Candidatus Cloacimonadota bacterium]MCK9334922.1 hypothetical protein [Candidatus Cloacimonadota bacterium]MDD2683551.1 hypothetical protein [Candidatus Cloacimonadota bacterium]